MTKIIHKHHPKGKKNDPNTEVEITVEEHQKIHGNTPNTRNPELLTAYKEYKLWQTEAGRLERMIGSYRGTIKNTTPSPYITDQVFEDFELRLKILQSREKVAEKILFALVRETPEWNGFLKNAPGMGEITAAMLLSKVRIDVADTVSSLWSYLGYVPNKENPSKREENPGKCKAFKSPLFAALNISLIKKSNPYRQDYDKFKTRGLNHYKSINRLTKLWLSHLWAIWREWAGLSIDGPYANNHLHHKGFISAKDRGWSQIPKETQNDKANLLSGSCPNLRPRNRSSVLTEDPSDPNGRMSKESIRSFSLTGKGHGGVRQPKHRQPDN